MILQTLFFPNKPFLFKKKINDELFGLMWFNKSKDPKFNHYQAHFIFKPSNHEIDIFFDADKEGINPRQKMFFYEIEKKYSELLRQIVQPVTEKLEKRKLREIKINDFSKEFTLFAISISRVSEFNQEWSLSYYSDKHSMTGFTINFKNWDIISID